MGFFMSSLEVTLFLTISCRVLGTILIAVVEKVYLLND